MRWSRRARLGGLLIKRTWCGVVVFTLMFLLGAGIPRASAQFDTATVVGTVKDTSGSSVADAKVTLTNTETGVSVVRTSNSEGNFEFVSVRPGLYLIAAERQGFSLALMDNLRVEVGARLRADLKLEVGALTEECQSAEGPALPLRAGRHSSHRSADPQPGIPIRVCDAVPGTGQQRVELQSGDARDGDGDRRRPLPCRSGPR